jgi:hypothetical protein
LRLHTSQEKTHLSCKKHNVRTAYLNFSKCEGQKDRDRKIHVAGVPEMLRVEGEALWPLYKFRTELIEVASAEL